ncbi:MAG: class I SAM-dependent methyltransferase [Planctomycetes bacterium]|nr:class I SAM-dependent methyltransferase [Planctomycetota bacterium]
MLVDPKQRFSKEAEIYHKYRPSYPGELIDWVIAIAALRGHERVVDVACGTGISSRAFASRGFEVIGIDPSEAMLERARSMGGARYVVGEAARTELPQSCCRLITVAQAFHWFALEDALPEFRRILEPRGWCAAFWNIRGRQPMMDEFDALLLKHSSEYPEYRGRVDAIRKTLGEIPGVATFDKEREALPQDRESFFGRAHSASYVAHGVKDKTAFDAGLGAIFDKYQRDGKVSVSYRNVGFMWQP